jgi:predicted phage tail protein
MTSHPHEPTAQALGWLAGLVAGAAVLVASTSFVGAVAAFAVAYVVFGRLLPAATGHGRLDAGHRWGLRH